MRTSWVSRFIATIIDRIFVAVIHWSVITQIYVHNDFTPLGKHLNIMDIDRHFPWWPIADHPMWQIWYYGGLCFGVLPISYWITSLLLVLLKSDRMYLVNGKMASVGMDFAGLCFRRSDQKTIRIWDVAKFEFLCFVSAVLIGIPHFIGYKTNGCTLPEKLSGVRVVTQDAFEIVIPDADR